MRGRSYFIPAQAEIHRNGSSDPPNGSELLYHSGGQGLGPRRQRAAAFGRRQEPGGGPGNDGVLGGEGSDNLVGGSGNDFLYGHTGSDSLVGEEGKDNVLGWRGPDRLVGGDGTDALWEFPFDETSKDIYSGRDGDDVLSVNNERPSKDIVSCGSGFDRVLADRIDVVSDDCERVFFDFDRFWESLPPALQELDITIEEGLAPFPNTGG